MVMHARDVIGGVLRRVKKQHQVQRCIERVLDEVLDPQTRKHVSVKGLEKKTLVLGAGSSAALYNTKLKKTDILEAVKQGCSFIENIKIRVC